MNLSDLFFLLQNLFGWKRYYNKGDKVSFEIRILYKRGFIVIQMYRCINFINGYFIKL